MVDLNKDFINGISELDCSKGMDKFLKKILYYELELYKEKSNTQTTISEQYRVLIENFSEEE